MTLIESNVDEYSYNFLKLDFETSITNTRSNVQYDTANNDDGAYHDCNNLLYDNFEVYVKYFQGMREYKPLEMVCIRIIRKDTGELIYEWLGCHFYRTKPLDIALSECITLLFELEYGKNEILKWKTQLPILMRWINMTERILNEAFLIDSVIKELELVLKVTDPEIKNLQNEYYELMNNVNNGVKILFENYPDRLNLNHLLGMRISDSKFISKGLEGFQKLTKSVNDSSNDSYLNLNSRGIINTKRQKRIPLKSDSITNHSEQQKHSNVLESKNTIEPKVDPLFQDTLLFEIQNENQVVLLSQESFKQSLNPHNAADVNPSYGFHFPLKSNVNIVSAEDVGRSEKEKLRRVTEITSIVFPNNTAAYIKSMKNFPHITEKDNNKLTLSRFHNYHMSSKLRNISLWKCLADKLMDEGLFSVKGRYIYRNFKIDS